MDDHNDKCDHLQSSQEDNKQLSILTEWLKADIDSESLMNVDTRLMYSDYLAHYYNITNPSEWLMCSLDLNRVL